MKAIRLPTIRSRLALLVTACVLPASLTAVALITWDYQRQRDQIVRDSVSTARAMSFAVDSDLASVVSALRALSTSMNLTKVGSVRMEPPARELVAPDVDKNVYFQPHSLDLSGKTLSGVARSFCDSCVPNAVGRPRCYGRRSRAAVELERGQSAVLRLSVVPIGNAHHAGNFARGHR